MTEICVSTGALGGAAQVVHRLQDAADRRGHDITSIARGLDMEIKARTHLDRHLGRLGREVAAQSDRLKQHAAVLQYAEGRYVQAEDSVVRMLDGDRTGAAKGGNWWDALATGALKTWARIALGFSTLLKRVVANARAVSFALKVMKYVTKVLKTGYRVMDKAWRAGKGLLKTLLQPLAKWAPSWGSKAKFLGRVGIVLTVVSGLWEGWCEFMNSTGTLARRISNAIFVGGGTMLAGFAATAVGWVAAAGMAWAGAKIGGTLGTFIGGPVGTVVGAVVGVAVGIGLELALKSSWGQAAKKWVGDRVEEAAADGGTVASGVADLVGGKTATGAAKVATGVKGLVANPLVNVLSPITLPISAIASAIATPAGVSRAATAF